VVDHRLVVDHRSLRLAHATAKQKAINARLGRREAKAHLENLVCLVSLERTVYPVKMLLLAKHLHRVPDAPNARQVCLANQVHQDHQAHRV